MQEHPNRRTFLKEAVVIGGAVLIGAPPLSAASRKRTPLPIRLGGPVFGAPSDPEGLARAHRALGYRAAYCPNVPLNDAGRIRAFAEAFAREDVVIAEVGRWVNLMDADPGKRKANLDKVVEGLALAEAIGARCCVDIAGSYSKTEWFGPHPKNLSKDFFEGAVENARKIIDAVKPKRTTFCYEMMGWALPDSSDSYLRLIKAIDRKAFGVHLDPCNLINSPTRFYQNTALLNESFDKLGKWIASCHAKDLAWNVEMNVHFKEVVPGTGALDYGTFLKRLAQLPHNPPLIMEHLANEQEYSAGRTFILAKGKEEGLAF